MKTTTTMMIMIIIRMTIITRTMTMMAMIISANLLNINNHDFINNFPSPHTNHNTNMKKIPPSNPVNQEAKVVNLLSLSLLIGNSGVWIVGGEGITLPGLAWE